MFTTIASLEQLTKAYKKASAGKRSAPFVCAFDFNLENNLINLQQMLHSGNYQPAPYTEFTVFDPKIRQVSAPHFRDRILQHSIYAQVEPLFEKSFIYDSYACRSQKGTHFGARRVKKFLMSARTIPDKNNPNKNFYVLQCDIKKYFQSIDWDILLSIIQKQVKCPKTFNLLHKIITTHSVAIRKPGSPKSGQLDLLFNQPATVSPLERKGLPIGNLVSQLCANIYLNELDQFVKHKLKARWYARYMDDFLIIHPSKKYLLQSRKQIKDFLESTLKLQIHPNKNSINSTKNGIPFVGYRIFYDHILVRGNTLRRIEQKHRKRLKLFKAGKITKEVFDSGVSSMNGHLLHANTYTLSRMLHQKPKPLYTKSKTFVNISEKERNEQII